MHTESASKKESKFGVVFLTLTFCTEIASLHLFLFALGTLIVGNIQQ